MKLTEPGIYDDVPADAYHGDLCAGPSLSSSGAREILRDCPAAFWWRSYMNPERPTPSNERLDFGTAAHTALLEPETLERRIHVVYAPDWRSKEARAEREAFRAEGFTPILEHQHGQILGMRDALYRHPVANGLWSDGKAEQTIVRDDRSTGAWLKSRPDFWSPSSARALDYKTALRAEASAFARSMWDYGYFQQAAWNVDALEAVAGVSIREFLFVVQEIEAPYLVAVYRAGGRALEWGRLLNRRAIDRFAECVERKVWPGYTDERVLELELPTFAEFQLEQRHEAGEFQGSFAERLV